MRTTFVLSLAVLASLVVTGSPHAAEAASNTTLTGASVTADKSTISGLDSAVLTVSLHLQDPDGVQPSDDVIAADDTSTQCPCAQLETVDESGGFAPGPAQSLNQRFVRLSLSSGSAQDGMWTGATRIGAINAGHWQLDAVIAGTLAGERPGIAGDQWHPVDGSTYTPGVEITGSHWPVLSLTGPARPVPYAKHYSISGKATYSDTGEPVANVSLGVDSFCCPEPYSLSGGTVTTGSDGTWSAITNNPTDLLTAGFGPEDVSDDFNPGPMRVLRQWESQITVLGLTQHWTLSLTARRSGATRYLRVQLSPPDPGRVQLQRKTSSGWQPLVTRTATNSNSTSTGSYTFTTHTPGLYRVRALGSYVFLMAAYTSTAVRTT